MSPCSIIVATTLGKKASVDRASASASTTAVANASNTLGRKPHMFIEMSSLPTRSSTDVAVTNRNPPLLSTTTLPYRDQRALSADREKRSRLGTRTDERAIDAKPDDGVFGRERVAEMPRDRTRTRTPDTDRRRSRPRRNSRSRRGRPARHQQFRAAGPDTRARPGSPHAPSGPHGRESLPRSRASPRSRPVRYRPRPPSRAAPPSRSRRPRARPPVALLRRSACRARRPAQPGLCPSRNHLAGDRRAAAPLRKDGPQDCPRPLPKWA